MGTIVDFKKLSKIKLGKRPTASKPKLVLKDLMLTLSWTEYDKHDEYIIREIRYEVSNDKFLSLTPEGRLLLAEICLDVVGLLAYKDLNLASMIKDKILSCVKDE